LRVIFAIIISFTLVLTGCTEKQKEEVEAVPVTKEIEKKTPVEYLADFHQSIDAMNYEDFSDLTLLSEDIEKHKVFLTGETHSVHLNYPLQTKLLFYLNQKAGVNYYLAEMPFAIGEFFNLYLETGDEELLTYIAEESKGTHGENDDLYTLVKDIYEYNKSQGAENRIRFLAIDGDTIPNVALNYINKLSEGKTIPEKISAKFALVDEFIRPDLNMLEQSRPELKNFINEWISEINTNESMYRESLGKDYEKFYFLLLSLKYGFSEIEGELVSKGEFNVVREGVFKESFLYWIDKLPQNAKFFGEWGREHVYLSEVQVIDPVNYYSKQIPHLAQILNEEIPQTKGKVLSIAYMYKNSNNFQPQSDIPSVKFEEDFNHIELLSSYADSDVTLFKLNGAHSPYSDFTIFMNKGIKEGTLNYFQYAVLIQNSKASKSYFDTDK